MIKEHAHIRMTLRGLDHGGVKCAAADRIDALVRVAIVGREMKRAGFIVDHAAAHGDGVLQDFVGDPKLREGVNPTGGKGEIDRSASNGVAGARIGPAFVEIDRVAAFPKAVAEQSASAPAAYESEFRSHSASTVIVSGRLPSAPPP